MLISGEDPARAWCLPRFNYRIYHVFTKYIVPAADKAPDLISICVAERGHQPRGSLDGGKTMSNDRTDDNEVLLSVTTCY